MQSPASRNLVNAGTVKVVGAVYDVSNGTIKWLPEAKTIEILKKVEGSPERAMDAMAK
jgi:carbonic anhydrase